VKAKTLNPLESALPQNAPITLLKSALPKSLDLNSFRIRTYKNRWGGGVGTVNYPCAPFPGHYPLLSAFG
jgi:hypothetical protein